MHDWPRKTTLICLMTAGVLLVNGAGGAEFTAAIVYSSTVLYFLSRLAFWHRYFSILRK